MDKTLQTAGIAVAGIGAVNWGLNALFDLDLVESVAGTGATATIVYAIVGIAGIVALVSIFAGR